MSEPDLPTEPDPEPQPESETVPAARGIDAVGRWQRLRADLRSQCLVIAHLLRWIVLGSVVGVLAGLSSAGFLVTLDWVTDIRHHHPWILWLLPVAGFGIGLVYHYFGGDAVAGNNLIIDEIHEPKAWIPRRMAPLIYLGTEITQLFGGSVGREGTALQMSGSLTDWFSRLARLKPADRRILLIAALAGGFGAVFSVPVAGFVFALEVQSIGRMRYDALVPAVTASLVGDLVVRGLGVHETRLPALTGVDLSVPLAAKVALAGLAFGLIARCFAALTHAIQHASFTVALWPPLRPFFGGVAVVGLTYLVGNRDYNGLSLGLIAASLAGGAGVVAFAFAWKLVFTAVTLGSGFQGGEVTPLFVMGATLGVTLGRLLGVDPQIMAAVGSGRRVRRGGQRAHRLHGHGSRAVRRRRLRPVRDRVRGVVRVLVAPGHLPLAAHRHSEGRPPGWGRCGRVTDRSAGFGETSCSFSGSTCATPAPSTTRPRSTWRSGERRTARWR